MFPYFPAGQDVHWLEFAADEYWPTMQPLHAWPVLLA
jgi:hypothetical protein